MRQTQRRHSRRGNAMVELAVSIPIFMMMVMGAMDFGRLFFEATVLSNAAATGGLYGAAGMQYATDTAAVYAAAASEAGDVQGFTAAPSIRCSCPSSMSNFYDETVSDCSTSCGDGYGSPRVYVRTQMQKSFQTFGWYPGVPETTSIDMNRWIRAQ